MFAGMTVVIALFFWFRYRARGEIQNTIRVAMEKGQEITPELVESLGSPRRPTKHRDLRFALIWLAVAAGIALFGAGMSAIEQDVFSIMLAISAFPLMIGIAYLLMWRFTEHEK